MNTNDIRKFIQAAWLNPLGEDALRRAVALSCQQYENLTAVQIITYFHSVHFEIKTDSHGYEHWLTHSPFDHMWYRFVFDRKSPWPQKPTYIYKERPTSFDQMVLKSANTKTVNN